MKPDLHLVCQVGGDEGRGAGGVGADAGAGHAEGVRQAPHHEAEAGAHHCLGRQLPGSRHHDIRVLLVHAAHIHACTQHTSQTRSLTDVSSILYSAISFASDLQCWLFACDYHRIDRGGKDNPRACEAAHWLPGGAGRMRERRADLLHEQPLLRVERHRFVARKPEGSRVEEGNAIAERGAARVHRHGG